MIEPPPKDNPYPGLLPPVREQWRRLWLSTRIALVVVPVAVAAVLLATAFVFGVFLTVVLAGSAAATVLYHKNRTDRHNEAVRRGEIQVVPDPHLRPATPADLDDQQRATLEALGFAASSLGPVRRFDGGWLVNRKSRSELAVVLGDDGATALFDPRAVSDLWAASEYRAGRGREVGRSGP